MTATETTPAPLYREQVQTYDERQGTSYSDPRMQRERDAFDAAVFTDTGLTPEYEAAQARYAAAHNGETIPGWEVWRTEMLPSYADVFPVDSRVIVPAAPDSNEYYFPASETGKPGTVIEVTRHLRASDERRIRLDDGGTWYARVIDLRELTATAPETAADPVEVEVSALTEGTPVPDAKLAKLRELISAKLKAEAEVKRLTAANSSVITDYDDPRLSKLWEDANRAADDRGYCEVYDQICEDIGAPGRISTWDIPVNVSFTMIVTAEGKNAEQAADSIEQGDVDDQAIEYIRGLMGSNDWETDPDSAEKIN